MSVHPLGEVIFCRKCARVRHTKSRRTKERNREGRQREGEAGGWGKERQSKQCDVERDRERQMRRREREGDIEYERGTVKETASKGETMTLRNAQRKSEKGERQTETP